MSQSLTVESLTVESLTVESLTVESLTVESNHLYGRIAYGVTLIGCATVSFSATVVQLWLPFCALLVSCQWYCYVVQCIQAVALKCIIEFK